jgi:hypothetical protein
VSQVKTSGIRTYFRCSVSLFSVSHFWGALQFVTWLFVTWLFSAVLMRSPIRSSLRYSLLLLLRLTA